LVYLQPKRIVRPERAARRGTPSCGGQDTTGQMLYNARTMTMRIIPDEDKPSAAIEIPLEKPLPDYDLEQIEQPTPRDVDAILVSQGFRDLIDDSRGVLMELLAHPPVAHGEESNLDLTHEGSHALELLQLTGAICPGDDEVYRPGLWIVIRDRRANPKAGLPPGMREHIDAIAREFMTRLQLE